MFSSSVWLPTDPVSGPRIKVQYSANQVNICSKKAKRLTSICKPTCKLLLLRLRTPYICKDHNIWRQSVRLTYNGVDLLLRKSDRLYQSDIPKQHNFSNAQPFQGDYIEK